MSAFEELALDDIAVLSNVRRRFDEEKLVELAASIREHGVIEPLIVRRAPERDDGRLELVAGERRLRAARMAGLERVPVRVMDLTREQAARLQLIENLQRQDLDPIEEAEGYRRLLDDHGYTQDRLAGELGVSQPHIANRLALLRLPRGVQESISRGIIPATTGRELLRIEKLGEKFILEAAAEIENRGASTREAAGIIGRLIQQVAMPLHKHTYPACEFDPSPCQGCAKMIRAADYDGTPRSWCLDKRCWGKKTKEAVGERQRQVAERVKQHGEVDLSALPYDGYQVFYDSEFTECAGCEHRKLGFRPPDLERKSVVCLDPACHRRLKAARGRQENERRQAAIEEEIRALEAAAEEMIQRHRLDRVALYGVPRDILVYLAGIILALVPNWYDRPTVGQWGKRCGLSLSTMGPAQGMDTGWEQRLQELEQCSLKDLWTIVLAWPAVAQGEVGIVRWLYGLESGSEDEQDACSACEEVAFEAS